MHLYFEKFGLVISNKGNFMGAAASQSTVKIFADRADKESGLKAAGNL